MDEPANLQLHVIDGWTTDDPTEFKFYTDTYRTWSVRQQLAVDARSWKARAMWLGTVVGIAVGALAPRPFGGNDLIGMGVLVGALYARMHYSARQRVRQARVIEGVVPDFEEVHQTLPHFRLGRLFPTGSASSIGTVYLVDWAVRRFMRPGKELQVLVSYSPEHAASPVIGIKPAPES